MIHNIQKLTWQSILQKEKKNIYFQNILKYINKQYYKGIIIYPPKKDIFNAFRFTNFNNIKVVIIGQDPYHQEQQANGLSFSVKPGIPIPPSLINIYKEISLNIPEFLMPTHGCLISWAIQGVLLLNSILTVEKGKPNSHANIGWETFTNKIIKLINLYHKKIVFLLWGKYAQKKIKLINQNVNYILTAPHPSPFSANRGFIGCKHFSKTNSLLISNKIKPINWSPMLLNI